MLNLSKSVKYYFQMEIIFYTFTSLVVIKNSTALNKIQSMFFIVLI